MYNENKVRVIQTVEDSEYKTRIQNSYTNIKQVLWIGYISMFH